MNVWQIKVCACLATNVDESIGRDDYWAARGRCVRDECGHERGTLVMLGF